MKVWKKSNWTIKYVMLVGVLLLATNVLLGFVLGNQSGAGMRALTERHMLSLSGAAAELMDGDTLRGFTAEDVGSPAYDRSLDQLAAFQSSKEIIYIYAVRPTDDGGFIFILDPDPIEPAAFGEQVVLSDALVSAGRGVAAVDRAEVTDRWGTHYSAYYPVPGSDGSVAAIVGVDFDTAWYDHQLRQHALSSVILTLGSVLIGALLVALLLRRARARFRHLNSGLTDLASGIDELTKTVTSGRGYKNAMTADEAESYAGGTVGTDGDAMDEIGAMDAKVRSMRKGMERYLAYVHAQTYTDALTRVGNTTAYQELVSELNARIADGSASFAIAMFDINHLKRINDEYSHACGDQIIQAAAAAIESVFGRERTYRIGGDEFVAVIEGVGEAELPEKLAAVEAAANEFNAADHPDGVELSLSMGTAVFRPGTDVDYRHLFLRADEAMYQVKREYYLTHGDRRRNLE